MTARTLPFPTEPETEQRRSIELAETVKWLGTGALSAIEMLERNHPDLALALLKACVAVAKREVGEIGRE